MTAGVPVPSGTEATWLSVLVCGLLLVAGLLLMAGLLTPVAGLATGATLSGELLFGWFADASVVSGSQPRLFSDAATILVLIVTIAIVLLGPGALSLDAYLFGRREIVIPHDRSPSI